MLRIAAAIFWLWLFIVLGVIGSGNVRDTDDEISLLESQLVVTSPSQLLMVPLTLIQAAASKGAGWYSLSLSSCLLACFHRCVVGDT